MDDYRRAAEKVEMWLDAHFDSAGRCTIEPHEGPFYPKAPYLLNAAGLRTKGARAARWALVVLKGGGVGKFAHPSGFCLITKKICRPKACELLTFSFYLFYAISEDSKPIPHLEQKMLEKC